MNEVYQSLDEIDADDSLAIEAAELQQRQQDWLSQIDFNKYAHFYRNLNNNKTETVWYSLT